MSERKSPVLPLAVALLLFAVVAAAVWFLIQPTPDAATITLPILNKNVSEFVALGALLALSAVIIVVVGLLIRILFGMMDKTISRVKTDDRVVMSLTEIEKRQKAMIKEYRQLQPPDPIPSHDRPVWTAVSTTLIMGLLFAFFGAAFSANFYDGANMGAYSFWFAITGLILGFFGLAPYNPERVQAIEQTEDGPIPSNALWVVFSGFAILIFGLGIMMWVRSQGG